jgi:transcriptional regulator with XRE-family HTH domain
MVQLELEVSARAAVSVFSCRAIDVYVGRRLRAKRRACGLTQHDLAELIHRRPEHIEAYEQGTMRIPPANLIALAEYLGVTLGFFFQEFSSADS